MNARNDWKRELQSTPDCVPVERFDAMTAADRDHIARCGRCEAEVALWKEFVDGETTTEELPVVDSIVNTLRPRSAEVVDLSSRRNAKRLRVMAVAATLLIVVGIGYVVENREPSIGVPIGRADLYRSARIGVIAPLGDLTVAPRSLSWTPVPGATSYKVQLFEVDRTTVWNASTAGNSIELPPAVAAKCVPGKTLLWEVAASENGAVLADSGTQRFRVVIP